jgi:hypothetical protein
MLRWSDGECEVVEGGAEPVAVRDVGGDVVVAAAEVLHERVPGGEDPRRAVPFRPRTGRSRAFSRPWSASIGLFAYCSTTCSAEGTSSSSTLGYTGARSVVTLTGIVSARNARMKKRRAAARSRVAESRTSMTWPYWVDRPVEIGSATSDLHAGLAGEPPISGSVPTGPGRLGELRREPLHPPVDSDVIHGDNAFGKQLLDIPVGQSIP